MPKFTSGAIGVIKNVKEENEEKLLFLFQDDEENEYFQKIDDKYMSIKNKNGYIHSVVNEGKYTGLLSEMFLFCNISFKNEIGK